MKLFRRGNRYLVMHSARSAWVFDADTGETTRTAPARDLMGSDGRDWLPVLETDEIPVALARLLIVRF